MQKKRDHPTRRPEPEVREVEAGDAEEVVRLNLDGEPESIEAPVEVERLEVEPLRPGQRSSGDLGPAAVMPELQPSAEVEEEMESVDPEEVWEAARPRTPRVPIGWVVVFGALLAGILGFAGWRIPKGDVKLGEKVVKLDERLEQERVEMVEAAELNEEILRVARGYLLADSVEEKLKYVRMPERVERLMRNHYETHEMIPRRTEGLYYFEPISLKNYPFLLLKMQLVGGGDWVLMLEELADGTVRVDWESDVAYQPMSLEEYVSRKPLEPMEFRVRACYDNFYSFEFSDAERYVNLFLTERDGPGFLFGYVERGSKVHDQVMEVLGKDEQLNRPKKERARGSMILRVRFLPESRGVRSVLVEELVAPGWAVVSPGQGGE